MQKKQKSVFVQNCKKPKNICILWTKCTYKLKVTHQGGRGTRYCLMKSDIIVCILYKEWTSDQLNISSKLDSPVIETLDRIHLFTLSECLSNALITRESNFYERNIQEILSSLNHVEIFFEVIKMIRV